MRYIDIINEEGAFNLTSENESISINITNIHPELIFEDNSMIIFSNIEAYYSFIGDANLFTGIDNDVNLEGLLEENLEDIDTVIDFSYKGTDVITVAKINYNGDYIYYLQRVGLNELG